MLSRLEQQTESARCISGVHAAVKVTLITSWNTDILSHDGCARSHGRSVIQSWKQEGAQDDRRYRPRSMEECRYISVLCKHAILALCVTTFVCGACQAQPLHRRPTAALAWVRSKYRNKSCRRRQMMMWRIPAYVWLHRRVNVFGQHRGQTRDHAAPTPTSTIF